MNFYGSTGPAGSLSQGNAATGEKIPKGYSKGSLQQFSPEQMQLFRQLFSNVSPESYLSKLAGGDQSQFEQIEAPAMRQFQELQGNIASRFSGAGMGARRGSGFNNTLNQQTSDFAMNLQAQRQELQRQAIRDLMGLGESLLSQRPYEQFLVKKQKKQPFWKQALGFISPLGGDLASGTADNTENFLKTILSMV